MYTIEQLATVIAKTKSLLNDIEEMKSDDQGDGWYGGFSDHSNEWGIEGDEVSIEWPNLEISSADLRNALKELDA